MLGDFERFVKPYATGNIHPMFMGWAQGAGTPAGMIADMLAAGMNSNCGGRNHIALDVERQIARWMASAFDFPPEASGIFVTGASMANFLCLLVARDQAYGTNDVRLNGLRALDTQLIAYTSREAHNCVRQAMELAGLGARHLRIIDSDERRGIKIDELHHAIAADRAAALLVCLGDTDGAVSVTDLSHALDLHKSTVSRLLSTLERRGLVEQDPETGHFHLGVGDRKSTRLNSSHVKRSRMPSSA